MNRNLQIVRGVLDSLDRTTHVSGGSNDTSTTTTHISMMRVNGIHVELRSSSPTPISEGESVTLVGENVQGLFKAYALRNDVTGWTTQVGKISPVVAGCSTVFMVLWVGVVLVMTAVFAMGSPPLALLPLAMGGFGVWAFVANAKKITHAQSVSQQAHAILFQHNPSSSPPPLPMKR